MQQMERSCYQIQSVTQCLFTGELQQLILRVIIEQYLFTPVILLLWCMFSPALLICWTDIIYSLYFVRFGYPQVQIFLLVSTVELDL